MSQRVGTVGEYLVLYGIDDLFVKCWFEDKCG